MGASAEMSMRPFLVFPAKASIIMPAVAAPYRGAIPKLEALTPVAVRATSARWLSGIGLVLLTLIAYFPLVRAGFIWDDDYYVFKNVLLRSAAGLWEIWAHPFHPRTPQYYPLTFTSFWIEYHLWGIRPLGYHVVNVALHALNTWVLWRLLRNLQVPGAYLAAAVFAIHPINVESVAWISERKNVLSGLLFLLALTAYLRWVGLTTISDSKAGEHSPHHASRWWYSLALALFVLALLAKTVTSSLPAVILLILYWKRGRVIWRDAAPLAPFFAFGISLGALTSWLERHVVGADGPDWQFSLPQRFLIAGRAVWFYAQKLLWPDNLTFIYPHWNIDPHSLSLYAFAAAAITLPIVLWLFRQRLGRGPLVAILFFGGCLVPALGFANLYPMRFSFVADHFQYLAGIGLILLAVGSGAWLLRHFAPNQPSLGKIIGAGLLTMLIVTTFLRTGVFRSGKLLWTDTIAKNPRAWIAYNNLAIILMSEKDYDGARLALDSAVTVQPDYVYARLNRVILDLLVNQNPAHAATQNTDLAIAEARKALADVATDQTLLGRTERSTAWKLRATLFFNQGNDPSAEDALRNLLVLEPDDLDARRDLARVLEHRHDRLDALAQWAQIIGADSSNAQAHAHTALLLAQTGHTADATQELAVAQKLDARYSTYTLNTTLPR
jgi:tetratricopeptide (TPR) repeat protein